MTCDKCKEKHKWNDKKFFCMAKDKCKAIYEKGRKDAIDECINLIEVCCPCEEVDGFKLLVNAMKKLKEKKQ